MDFILKTTCFFKIAMPMSSLPIAVIMYEIIAHLPPRDVTQCKMVSKDDRTLFQLSNLQSLIVIT